MTHHPALAAARESQEYTMSMQQDEEAIVHHDVLFPAVTDDYRIAKGKFGFQLVANRRIRKGRPVFDAGSLEFLFGQVIDGDRLFLSNREEAIELAGCSEEDIPTHINLTRHMLMYTHGLAKIQEVSSEEIVTTSVLEVPGMLMNHSCDANVIINSSHQDIAARNIEEGEELTVDYGAGDWDSTPVEDCSCGASNCRGKAIAFKFMSEADQERSLSQLSEGTRAEYMHSIGKGPKVRDEDPEGLPRTLLPTPTTKDGATRDVLRLVYPGPGSAEADVMVRKVKSDDKADVDSLHEYGLFATKDVPKGDVAYIFWMQDWPCQEDTVIDMVFATQEFEGDPEEGLVIRFDPSKCGAYRNVKGNLQFSGWAMLTGHSCDPNLVYRNKEAWEEDNWQSMFAAKDIKKGDRLSVDFNCFIWDRSESGDAVCHCGAPTCTGAKHGFKYLSPEAQNARRAMTWLREASPEDTHLDRALSPNVRETLKKEGCPGGVLLSKDSKESLSSTSDNVGK